LRVSGVNGSYISSSIGIGTSDPSEKLVVIGNVSINDSITQGSIRINTETSSEIGIHSGLSTSTYRLVEYTIQATQGINFHATKLLVLHDGSGAYVSEYGTVYNNSSVSEFNVDISSGNIRLLATPSSSSLTKYVINFVATKI
jgi:hypothetical protein